MSDERRPPYPRAPQAPQGASTRPRTPRANSGSERQLFDAVCEQCQVEFRVPFRPTPGRLLLCKLCLKASRENPTSTENFPQAYQISCSHCGKLDRVPFQPYEGSVVLCQECMNNPNVERVGGKILHSIICSVCGQKNSVPFKPDAGSRVLCRDCHTVEREEKQRSRDHFSKTHPSVVHNTKVRIEIRCDRCGAEDSLPFVPKTQGQILCRQCGENTFGEDWSKRHKLGASEYPFSCVRCAAQDFVPFVPRPDHGLLCKHCLNHQAVIKGDRDTIERHDAFTRVRRAKVNKAPNQTLDESPIDAFDGAPDVIFNDDDSKTLARSKNIEQDSSDSKAND